MAYVYFQPFNVLPVLKYPAKFVCVLEGVAGTARDRFGRIYVGGVASGASLRRRARERIFVVGVINRAGHGIQVHVAGCLAVNVHGANGSVGVLVLRLACRHFACDL